MNQLETQTEGEKEKEKEQEQEPDQQLLLLRVKEIMGDSFDDHTIFRALNFNQNNLERAIHYLLEPDHPSPLAPSQSSISNVFNSSSDWPLNSSWSQLPPDRAPPIHNLIQPILDPRDPIVLPNSPPKDLYQPLTVTGQTTPTDDFRISDQPFQISRPHLPLPTTQLHHPPTSHPSTHLAPTKSTPVQLIDDPRYDAELNAAIQASLASDPALNQLHPTPPSNVESNSLKNLSAEDEQMTKALEESLAMSGSRTLEPDNKFSHPPANNRIRTPGSPTALRVHNPHLVFLPCLLSAMYAAKPFRDRILTFNPTSQVVNQQLIDSDFHGVWNGKSCWRSGDNWPEKAQSAEIILGIQRLFILMTHTNRSYLDVQEISSLLGYEEGEMISWSLNEPNKGCHRTYETIAEAWRDLSWEIFKLDHPPDLLQQNQNKLWSEFQGEQRLFHWKGHKLPLPLPEDETTESLLMPSADNSTTSLTLDTLDSSLNDIYSCIDAQVWLPESNQAHFLNGVSEVIAFEIDRKSSSSSSTWGTCSSPELLTCLDLDMNHNLIKSPFKLQPQFWVDRYLIQNRFKIIELREEISRIEGEADVSLARRTQLSKIGGKDFLSTLKATVDYLSISSQFPTPDITQREKIKKEMLPKFQESLRRLEAELASLDEKARTALTAAKAVFDVDEMKQIGPHELCSVVVSDGFSGRDHMWIYIKTDDGRWFKSIDQTVIEVSIETVLSDPAGIHLNSGHIFAIYVRKPSSDECRIDSQSIPITAHYQKSIIKDNELLDAEVLESATTHHASGSGYNLERRIDVDDVEMTANSPRSDVADAGGPLELDLINTGSDIDLDITPPIRLYGGALSIPSDHDLDSCDSGSDEFDQDDDLVELGFLKKIEPVFNLKSSTGKVGGRPIWLDPSSPLEMDSIKCSECNQTMTFLLQLNAPDDMNPKAYYRSIYVFICTRSACWSDSTTSTTSKRIETKRSGCVKVFRNQISSNHQSLNSITTKSNSKDLLLGGKNRAVFKEWEIVSDLEPIDDIIDRDSLHLADKLKACKLEDTQNKKCGVGTKIQEVVDGDSSFEESKSKVDDEFLYFQSRISRAPHQILRYLRVTVPEIEPIWVNEKSSTVKELIETQMEICSNCGGERRAEFQILSTLISHLEPDDDDDGDDDNEPRVKTEGIDFGTLIVYTCSHSCSSIDCIRSGDDGHSDEVKDDGSSDWIEETCLVQFFSQQGLFF